MQQYSRDWYQAAFKLFKRGGIHYKLSGAYLWNVVSWDAQVRAGGGSCDAEGALPRGRRAQAALRRSAPPPRNPALAPPRRSRASPPFPTPPTLQGIHPASSSSEGTFKDETITKWIKEHNAEVAAKAAKGTKGRRLMDA